MSSKKDGVSTASHGNSGVKKRPADNSLAESRAKKPKSINSNGNGNGNGNGNSKKTGRDTQPNNRASKWAKTKDIREIAAQPCDAALKDGELDVQAFVNSRSFEIKALDESMRRTQTSRTSRAFQLVPFTLRRRAGAHNHKRVPKRLQNRARKEMGEDNTPLVSSRTRKSGTTRARVRAETALRLGKLAARKRKQKLAKKGDLDEATIEVRAARPKIKRNTLNEPVVVVRKFRKRQLNKTWLPTHLWHTKRARMTPPTEPLWRFAMPLTPTQKVHRSVHRAGWERGAVAWDVSFMSTIGLSGTPRSIEHVLRALGLSADGLWSTKGEKWRTGTVHWSGSLSRKCSGTLKMIGPATILWNPQSEDKSVDSGTQSGQQLRRIFLRIHPSAFLETFEELLRLVKGQNPRPYIEDLRYEIGSIDVTGPSSTEALLGILHPYHSKPESTELHASRFKSLSGLRDSASLPSGSLLAFSILDPRLRHPPRPVAMPDMGDSNGQSSLLNSLSSWGQDQPTKPHDLFDRNARFKASRLPSQQSLNRRRGKGVRGVFLEPTQVDPAIPIILLVSRPTSGSGTWTVMMPWKCVLPAWYSLMHYPLCTGGNPTMGGMLEQKQLAFERGLPWFPGDFPGTDSGTSWELEQRQQRKKAWDRMPKGKRVNYETLDLGAGRRGEVGVGWSCDYETLLGSQKPDQIPEHNKAKDSKDVKKEPEKPPKASSDHPLAGITLLSKFALNAQLALKAEALPPKALVLVKITVLGRGVPDPCARVYRLPAAPTTAVSTQAEVPATEPPPARTASSSSSLPPDLRAQWLAKLPANTSSASKLHPKGRPTLATPNLDLKTRTRLLAQELLSTPLPYPPEPNHQASINGHPLCPDAEDLIGFVTSGGFNLRAGRAEAVGSISASSALAEMKRGVGAKKDDAAARVVVVRNAGENIGWIARWELV